MLKQGHLWYVIAVDYLYRGGFGSSKGLTEESCRC